jgi:competence protein ComEA
MWGFEIPRDLTLPVAAAVILLFALGAASRGCDRGGRPPATCERPAWDGASLRCDGEGAPPGPRAWLVGRPMDLARATPAQLTRVPGVGRGLAARIVAAGEARGGFESVDDLDEIDGVGPKTLAKLRAYVEVTRSSGER